jgi:hypothetical protein
MIKFCAVLLILAISVSVSAESSPYPASTVITKITWAPVGEVIRKAQGSDNWPMTWADDDNLYTAYGDGKGFTPQVPNKLSLGYAKVTGMPPGFTGINIRSSDEQYGDGSSGKKACGMLMVDGRLYMWVRNAGSSGEQCQLAWSDDYAQNWTWSTWKFAEFGYCTFLNYGRNYAGAPDSYVYTYTPNGPDAYENYDHFVLMRVHKDSVTVKSAYQFFTGLDNGNPTWNSNISQRQPVFSQPGRCWRSSVSFNPAINRYIWWQVKMDYPSNLTARYDGGLGVFDAPTPWGPWTTAFYIGQQSWDMGAGETGCFPTKWMSSDGKTMWMACAGDDAFSVRKATLEISSTRIINQNKRPLQHGLIRVAPNPVNLNAFIEFDVSNAGTRRDLPLQLAVYDINGRMISDLSSLLFVGQHRWFAGNLAPGTYVLEGRLGNTRCHKRITLTR